MHTVLEVTDAAVEKIVAVRAREVDADALALWVEVSGVAHGRFAYDLFLAPLELAAEADAVEHHGVVPVVVPAASIELVRGARLDRDGDLATGGLVVDNPRSPTPAIAAGAAPADLSSPVAQRILALLREQVNPAIASHGGDVQLVAVEGATAYVRMTGGCQGCGMASFTLTEGIQTAIRASAPEITAVVDVTDHAAGTNPYFEPSPA
ncbi:MAG TPA: NifU family protein [Gaiellales bacterium]|nr:NifU family protein [Gaiellales bacterium]